MKALYRTRPPKEIQKQRLPLLHAATRWFRDYEYELSASHPGRRYRRREIAQYSLWVEGWVGPRTVLNVTSDIYAANPPTSAKRRIKKVWRWRIKKGSHFLNRDTDGCERSACHSGRLYSRGKGPQCLHCVQEVFRSRILAVLPLY